MHSLWLEMFYHSVNMTIKLWPQACRLSADDAVCIKAARGGNYNNRWREQKKDFMSCWEKMKGAKGERARSKKTKKKT